MNANMEITKEVSKIEVNKVEINNRIYRLIKRIVDIIGAIVGCMVLIPLTIIVYIANMLQGDMGPIFYVQKRIGKNGKPFRMYKYRSMVVDADKKLKKYLLENADANEEFIQYRKLRQDPRVTAVGKFLRKTSLDEFPQFINILKGEMSFVGPRPYLFREKRLMKEEYYEIIKVKPGLTGPWQVTGRSDTNFEIRLKMDKEYSNKCSFLLDIKYFFKTFSIWLGRNGAL